MSKKPPKYVRITDAAKRLGVSRQMVYKFMYGGRLGEQIDGRWRITRRQLYIFSMQIREAGRPWPK